MLVYQGAKLPLRAFMPDGIFLTGSTMYEKLGIAINVREPIPDNCIQCNQCSLVCPHPAIRAVFVREEDLVKNGPKDFITVEAKRKGLKGLRYSSR